MRLEVINVMALTTDFNLRTVGKVATKVYYYRDGVLIDRPYFIPVQPGTPAQLAWWAVFRNGVTEWQALSPAQKAVWNKKSMPLQMSGFNLFMRKYLLP